MSFVNDPYAKGNSQKNFSTILKKSNGNPSKKPEIRQEQKKWNNESLIQLKGPHPDTQHQKNCSCLS